MNDEQRLRTHFAVMRDEEAARTPQFEQVLRRARPSRRSGVRALAVTGFAAAIVLGTVLHVSHGPTPQSPDASASLAHWRSPTDFLLQTPGLELLHSVPLIGDPVLHGLPPFPGLDDKPRQPTAQETHS